VGKVWARRGRAEPTAHGSPPPVVLSTTVGSYTYCVDWSPGDGEWVGLVNEFPSLSWLAAHRDEALYGIRDLVDSVAADISSEEGAQG